jgi:membrane-associated phospholipid phosphatase
MLAAVFIYIGVVARSATRPTSWETSLLTAARDHPPRWVDGWVRLFDRNPFVLLTFALTVVALVRKQWAIAIGGAIGCLVAAYSAEHLFKHVVEDDFPSAHATGAAAFATFAWCIARKRRIAELIVGLTAFAIPLAVAWSVVSVGMHLPADAIGGLLLGPLVVGTMILVATYVAPMVRARVRSRAGSSEETA